MIEGTPTPEKSRKTPDDANEFEREQLKFFLSQGDLATTLATLNPSLAWLPMLSQMKLIQNERQLVSWIERNFADVQAIRDVVANLRFFGPDTATFLEFRLNAQAELLPPLLVKSWRLIIRHMRTTRRGILQNDWIEIAPRIKRQEASSDLLARLAEALRPKLRLSKRFAYPDASDQVPEFPWQLMSIDYEVEDDVTAEDVLSAWPKDTAPETDAKLLSALTGALITALDDATDVGVETNEGYSTSDSDVPSVATHEQNAHKTGFQAIGRTTADLWERLAAKSPALALPFVEEWGRLPFRLMRRIALFASANPVVPSEFAADMLIALPQGELFLTGSTVEVIRLIRTRWNTFPKTKRDAILHRLCEGPPRDWLRADGDVEHFIDRSRFDILAEIERAGFDLRGEAGDLLNDIRTRWPQWQPRPPEQAGFHVWHGGGWVSVGDPKKLEGLPEGELVGKARQLAASSALLDGDDWHALCLSDPDRALRGLDAAASRGDWPPELWQQLLWTRKEYAEPDSERRIAELLLHCKDDSFAKIAPAASAWLNEHARTLEDATLWRLWDRIAEATLAEENTVPSDA